MTDAEIVELVLRHEGVWDDHPADAGGRTAYGISSRYHPEAWANGPPTREQAIAIYLKDYVAPFDAIEPELKPQVVDIAVNSGVTTARALYAVAKANHGSRPANTQLVIERLKHLARIVKAKPTQSVFLPGWVNRAVSFLAIALLVAGTASAQQPPMESSLGALPLPPIVGMSGSRTPLWPDRTRTPGDTVAVTVKAVCTPGYSKTARHVTPSVRQAAFAGYGLTPSGAYELDHLISLELGGSNAVENLWPQAYATQPWNARKKDALENRLHWVVCHRGLSLSAAQHAIATDWIAAYRTYVVENAVR